MQYVKLSVILYRHALLYMHSAIIRMLLIVSINILPTIRGTTPKKWYTWLVRTWSDRGDRRRMREAGQEGWRCEDVDQAEREVTRGRRRSR